MSSIGVFGLAGSIILKGVNIPDVISGSKDAVNVINYSSEKRK